MSNPMMCEILFAENNGFSAKSMIGTIYRASSKTVCTLFFVFSQLPRHLEYKSLTFLKSILHEHEENVITLIPRIKFDQVSSSRV